MMVDCMYVVVKAVALEHPCLTVGSLVRRHELEVQQLDADALERDGVIVRHGAQVTKEKK